MRKKQTANVAEPISGEKLFQVRARAALPLLVRQALARSAVCYTDLATELGMSNPRNLNYVLGAVGRTLERLSRRWDEKVPPIQSVVYNKTTGLPGHGIGGFFMKPEAFAKLTPSRKKRVITDALESVFAYPHWPEVLKALQLKPAGSNNIPLIASAARFRGGGESDAHRRLKEYVAANAHKVGVQRDLVGSVEYALPSGDSVDVVFDGRAEWTAVEVKPSTSPEKDVVRGIFQCVKYRAVIEALHVSLGKPQTVRAILVLEGKLPMRLVQLKNILGVEVLEGVKPRRA
jgi:hypothetical protein